MEYKYTVFNRDTQEELAMDMAHFFNWLARHEKNQNLINMFNNSRVIIDGEFVHTMIG